MQSSYDIAKQGIDLRTMSDETVRFWHVEHGTLLGKLEGHNGWVWKVTLSADGSMFATGSHDRTVYL